MSGINVRAVRAGSSRYKIGKRYSGCRLRSCCIQNSGPDANLRAVEVGEIFNRMEIASSILAIDEISWQN